ncbi:hypothetical protein [Sorangium sp. So ce1151]|uniref:hypothetical protein n=1 Tax=Sorangium sp. So ce1151 TaxID=3133332 RepID=UPI003F5EE41D
MGSGIFKTSVSLAKDTASLCVGIMTGDAPEIVKSIAGIINDTWSLTDEIENLIFTPYVEVPGVGAVYSRPAVNVNGNVTQIFYQGAGNTLYCITSTSSVATPSQALPGLMPILWAPPAAVMFNDQLYVFYQGTQNDGEIWCSVYDGTSWSAVTVIGTGIAPGTAPAAVVWTSPSASGPQLFVLYTTNAIPSNGPPLYAVQGYSTSDGKTWSFCGEIFSNNLVPTSSPSAVVYQGALYIFAVGTDDPAYPQTTYPMYATVTTWEGDFTQLPDPQPQLSWGGNVSALTYTPSGSTTPLLYIFYPWGGVTAYMTFDGSTWSSQQMVNAAVNNGNSPTASVFTPEAFSGEMASSTDIYIGAPIYNSTVTGGTLQVGSMSQYAAGDAPSQVVSFAQYSGPSNCAMLPVSFSTDAQPQAWVIAQWASPQFEGLGYAVYTPSGWVIYTIPTTTPAGSPSAATAPGSGALCLAYNTTSGAIVFTSLDPTTYAWVQPTPTNVAAVESPSLIAFNNLLYLFYQGSNSQVCYATSSNGGTSWTDCGAITNGLLTGSPSAVAFNGELYVFYQGCDDAGTLWYNCLSSSGWGTSTQAVPVGASGKIMTGSPAAVTLYDNATGGSQLAVFYASPSGQLTGCVLGTDNTWSQFQVPGVTITGSPSAFVAPSSSKTNIFYQPSTDPGCLWYSVFDGSDWSPSAALPVSTISGTVSGAMFQAEREPGQGLSLFYNSNYPGSAGGQICVCQCTPPTQSNVRVENASFITGAPTAVTLNNSTCVFYQGAFATAGIVCYQETQSLSLSPTLAATSTPGWSTTGLIPNSAANADGAYMTNSPSAAVLSSSAYVFYAGLNGQLFCSSSPASVQWSSGQISSITMNSACSPSAVNYNNTLYVFYVGSGAANLAYTTSTDGSSWSAPSQTEIVPVNEGVSSFVYNGTLYLIYQGGDSSGSGTGEYFYAPFPGTGTPTPTQIGALALSTGAAMAAFNGRLWCMSQGATSLGKGSQQLWYAISPNGAQYWSWNSRFNSAVTASTTTPAVAVFPPQGPSSTAGSSLLYVFYQNDGQIFYHASAGSGTSTTPQNQLAPSNSSASAAIAQGSPSAVAFPPLDSPTGSAQLYVFYQGATSGQLWYAVYDGSSWGAQAQLVPSGSAASAAIMSGSPAAVAYPALGASGGSSPQLYVFYHGPGGASASSTVPLFYSVYAAGAWTQSQVPITYESSSGMSAAWSPQAVVFGGVLYVFYVTPYAPASSGGLAFSTFDGSSWSAVTFPSAGGTANVASFPYPVVFNGVLYVYFQNTQEAGELWYTSTSDGSTWSNIAQAAGAQLVTSSAAVQMSEQIQSVVDNTASVADDLGIPDLIFGDDDEEG